MNENTDEFPGISAAVAIGVSNGVSNGRRNPFPMKRLINREDIMIKDYINGLQHIGIPTDNMDATVQFYQSLGFSTVMETKTPDGQRVAFLTLHNLMIETYEGSAIREDGAVNHIALDVSDIQAAYEEANKANLHVRGAIGGLPFWENGIRYFIVTGPNNEAIEFCQRI